MAKPAKPISVSTGNITKEQRQARQEAEDKLKSGSDAIMPPDYLNENQKIIFTNIVTELKNTGLLTNLDNYILAICAVAVDRLQAIETLINEDIKNLKNREVLSAKDKYSKELFRCFTELSLSPAARAKLGCINVQTKQNEADPLLQLLKKNKERGAQ